MRSIKLALAHLADSREDFYEIRRTLVDEEMNSFTWLVAENDCLISNVLRSEDQIFRFAKQAREADAEILLIHIPIWADPLFALKLANELKLPTMLVGNLRPETSSMVGVLGAGGALDQIGLRHRRVFNIHDTDGKRKIRAFVHAAKTRSTLRGQTLALFGGASLGIFTAGADAAQWEKLFGVNIVYVDQSEIRDTAESLPRGEVEKHFQWLTRSVSAVIYNKTFTVEKLEKQVRSYLATRKIASERGFHFVGVKCQPELSDGYVTQCVAHMLLNGDIDADGSREILVHACESDADAALTMQIMHLVSGGPSALLDLRWFDPVNGTFVLANCGAMPAAFCATPDDPAGLREVSIEPHVFGKEGGGALPSVATPQTVTLARLCRYDGAYWMAILKGEVVRPMNGELQYITPAFPHAMVKTNVGMEFLESYSSNHIHMASGDITLELELFCEMTGIPCKKYGYQEK